MQVKTLKLTNFRNQKDLKIDFDEGSTLIVGPNGCGKSNILEAIHLLSTTKSLRTRYDVELIRHGAKISRIEAIAEIDDDETKLEMAITKSAGYKNASRKIVKINKVNKSLTNFAGTLNSVLFTPTDIEILAGSPSIRRKYIDSIFFQIDKDYKRIHSQYTRAVRQRNKILEKISEGLAGRDQLVYWNDKILELGSNIQRKRRELFTFVQKSLTQYEKKLNSQDVEYRVKYKRNKITGARLEEYKKAEIGARRTLLGPHRDDFAIEFNGFDLASFGSRGQQRTTILALKLCEIDFITQYVQKRPILLLDDIFSELDSEHKEAVYQIIDLQQTIITTAQNANENMEIEKI